MNEIKSARTLIKDVEFKNPSGAHGKAGSTSAHNELLNLIDSSSSYEEYIIKLNVWAAKRLKDGVLGLPSELRR